MASYKFVDNDRDIINSVIEFNKEPNYLRKMVGSHPRYFIHVVINGRQLFGLSKFCAFKDIAAEEYLAGKRKLTGGGTTRDHLEKTTEKKWSRYNDSKKDTKLNFKKWINTFFPNYNVNNANIITIKDNRENKVIVKNSTTTQEELEKILRLKKLIGDIGEQIALKYEHDRLSELGAENPFQYITYTAKLNVNAGFDIFSDFNSTVRFIEVKSTVKGNGDIYITKNELDNFYKNPTNSYLYIVNVTDLNLKEGMVIKEINNIKDLGNLEPILYRVIK